MTICEFEERYYLHDSELTKIEYDSHTCTALFVVDFCYWMQLWYVKGEPKNGFIGLKFNGVSFLKYDETKGNGTFGNSIHDIEVSKDGMLIFQQTDDDTFEYYETIIKAESVEVYPLPDYVDPSER